MTQLLANKDLPSPGLLIISPDEPQIEIVRSILSRIRENVARYFGVGDDPQEQDEAFRELLLSDPHGCIPEHFLGGSLFRDIAAKFRTVFDAIRTELAEREGIDYLRLPVRVEAHYDGETYVDILYEPPSEEGRAFLLYTYGAKPWAYWFENLAELEREVGQIYQILETQQAFVHRILALQETS